MSEITKIPRFKQPGGFGNANPSDQFAVAGSNRLGSALGCSSSLSSDWMVSGMDSKPSSTPAQQQPQPDNNDVGFSHIPLPNSRRTMYTGLPASEGMPSPDDGMSADIGMTSPASRATASTAPRSGLRSAATSPANSSLQSPPTTAMGGLQSPPTTVMSPGESDRGGMPRKPNVNLAVTAATAATAGKGASSQTQRGSSGGSSGGGSRPRRGATSASSGTAVRGAGGSAKPAPTVGLGLHSTGTQLPSMITEEEPDPVLDIILNDMIDNAEGMSERPKSSSRRASGAPPTATGDEAKYSDKTAVTEGIANLMMNISEAANSSPAVGSKVKSKSSPSLSSLPQSSSSPQPPNNSTAATSATNSPKPLAPISSSPVEAPTIQSPNQVPPSPPASLDYNAWPLPDSPRTRLSQTRATSDSAYDRARGMEIHRSEWKHAVYRFPVKGAKHWVIDCDLTESSHARLSDVARRSSEGFEWSGEYELANIYRVLATVHRQFMEEMRADRLKRVEQMRRDRRRTLVAAGAPVTAAAAPAA